MNRILKNAFSPGMFALLGAVSRANAQSFVFDSNIGSVGAGAGQLLGPQGIALDSGGNIYTTDSGNNRVEEFSGRGGYARIIGGAGSGDGQLNLPRGVMLDDSGVYVVDAGNNRVEKFNRNGAFAQTIGGFGSNDGQLNNPTGIARDSSGNLYVLDSFNHRIEEFNSSGFVRSIASGQLSGPTGITLDGRGNFYVVDGNVKEFDSGGSLIRAIGSTPGAGNGHFNLANSVALDGSGNVYVSDSGNNRIEEFDGSGGFVQNIGYGGAAGSNANGQLFAPGGLAFDGGGSLYVADSGNNRIVKFRNTAVPEPGSIALLVGAAASGAGVLRRRRR